MKIVERISMGDRGRGSLVRFEGVRNWYVAYYVKGTEHRETTGTPDLKKARRFHRRRMDEVSADRQGLRKFIGPVAQRVQVDELLDDLEKDYKLRGIRSAHNVRSHAKPIRQYFGATRAVDVTAEMVDRFVEDRVAAGKAPATINRATQILGQAFRLARKRHKVVAIPDIRHLPERNARQGFFERDQFDKVVGALPEHLQDVALFGYLTGWRRGEILGLRWSDVDLEGGAVRLRPEASKNGHARVLILDATLRSLMARRERARLVEQKDGDPKVVDLVFHRSGEPIVDIRKAWATACVKAGLYQVEKDETGVERVVPDRLFHDLRRTAVRNLVKAGVPERVAMEVSGHKTRSMFDRYHIVNETDLRDAQHRVGLRFTAASPAG